MILAALLPQVPVSFGWMSWRSAGCDGLDLLILYPSAVLSMCVVAVTPRPCWHARTGMAGTPCCRGHRHCTVFFAGDGVAGRGVPISRLDVSLRRSRHGQPCRVLGVRAGIGLSVDARQRQRSRSPRAAAVRDMLAHGSVVRACAAARSGAAPEHRSPSASGGSPASPLRVPCARAGGSFLAVPTTERGALGAGMPSGGAGPVLSGLPAAPCMDVTPFEHGAHGAGFPNVVAGPLLLSEEVYRAGARPVP